MSPRIPLLVAVVGALLVGGATTGSTRASWQDQEPVRLTSVSSGSMGFTATYPGTTVPLLENAAAATPVEVTVTDTTPAAAKNLRQAIRVSSLSQSGSLQLNRLRITVTKKTGASCPTSTAGMANANGYSGSTAELSGPATGVTSYVLCVRLRATAGSNGQSGTLTLALQSRQRSASGTDIGWSSSGSVAIPVQVGNPPSSPGNLNCARSGSNIVVSWSAVSGATYYEVWRDASTDSLLRTVNAPATSATFTEAQMGSSSPGRRYDLNVLAGNSFGESAASDITVDFDLNNCEVDQDD